MMDSIPEATAQTPKAHCKNCGEKLSKRGKFCPSCGQRDFDGRIRMRELLNKFFSNITHLDNKFVKMAWELLVPARVSVHYFQGQIKRYPHPVQFFFLVMFFFLLMFSKQFDDVALNVMGGSISVGVEDSVTEGNVTVSKSNLFAALERCVTAKEYRMAYDSLPPSLRDAHTREAMDSIHEKVSAPWEKATALLLTAMRDDSIADPGVLDTIALLVGVTRVKIATRDFVKLEPESIIKKYGFSSWDEKLLVKQGIKSIRDQQGLIHRFVGSFGWAVLVLVSLMACVLRLLYWKRKRYYVEHFIFLMHQQSGIFLFLTGVLLVNEYLFPIEWGWLAVLSWPGLFSLLSMRRFYRENWWWTIFKWLIYIPVYILSLIFLFIASLLVVFVIF